MRTTSLLGACSLALVILMACGGEDSTDAESTQPAAARSNLARERTPQVSDEDKVALVDGQNDFAFDLYDLIRIDEGASKNMFFSPTSITLALSMVYAGARGQTAGEMAGVLHYALPPERLFPAFNWLDQELESRGDAAYALAVDHTGPDEPAPNRGSFRSHIVNSMWGEQSVTFEKPFLDTLAVNYGAGVFLADFKGDSDAERIRINDWVAGETLGRIEDLIPKTQIDHLTRAVLVNAVHLKLPWTQTFSPADDLSFTRLDGSTVSAQAIAREQVWLYSEASGRQAVRIPLEGGSVELLVVAPRIGDLDTFEEALSAAGIEGLVDGMEPRTVTFRMPKLHFTTESIALRTKLETLGMITPFAKADFSGIAVGEPLYLAEVVHKAMLGIDEKGVEAAAASAVVVGGIVVGPPEYVRFDVDRPFFVALVDGPTNTLLFVGHIVDPTG